MAHHKTSSKKRKQHTPQVRKTTELTAAQTKDLQKRTKAIKARTEKPSLLSSPWFWIPCGAALITSPALAIFMAIIGCLVAGVGACLGAKDTMRAKLIAAGLGAVLGSVPYLIYLALRGLGIVG